MTGTALRLGLDLGTSSLKAVVLDPSGAVVATGSSSYATQAGADGRGAEQRPADWLRAAGQAVAEIRATLGHAATAGIGGIGLAGQLPTLVALGAAGPLPPAVTWLDDRADGLARAVVEEAGGDALYRRTGMRIDGRYLAPMFRHHFGHRHGDVRGILSAKDYLCFALTGRSVTDPSTAAGYAVFGLEGGTWDDELVRLWQLDPALLPEIAPSNAVAGPLHEAGSSLLGLPAGLPVSVGAADSVASALAMGGLEEGTAVVTMGSSTVILDSVRRPVLDGAGRYILTPHAAEGWYGREMDLLATGTGFDWLCRLFEIGPDRFAAEALAAPVGAAGVSFAPYLGGGEQGALWDPSLRGAVHGLALRHRRGDILRAFLEGVMFEIRRCLAVLGEAQAPRRVVVAGHLAASPGLLGMLADVLHLPVAPWPGASPAAVGAALNAPVAGAAAAAAAGASAEPSEAADAYEALYEAYLRRYPLAAR